jgi:hypothetical protein
MFKIELVPIAASFDSVITVKGKVITIDGAAVDLSPLADGDQCEAERPIVGTVKNVGGVYSLAVEFRYNSATAEPEQSADPRDYVVLVSKGQIPDVIKRRPIPADPVIVDEPEGADDVKTID